MSVIPIPVDMTDIELRKLVVKDTDERLRAELKRGQTHFDSSTIEGMSRDDLVANVTLLRHLAGQTNAVQTVVTTFTGLSKPSVTPQPSATASAASVQPPSDGSIATILALLMQQQESARQERAEREAKEERLLQLAKQERADRDAKEERLMQLAKQEKAELLLLAKQEKEEKEVKEERFFQRAKQEKEEREAKEKQEKEEKEAKEKQEKAELLLLAKQEKDDREAKEERFFQRAKLEKDEKEAKEKQEKEEKAVKKQLEREERVEAARLEADRVRLALLEADKERQIVRDIQERSNRLAEEEAAAAERRHKETMAHTLEVEKRNAEDKKRLDVRMKKASDILRNVLYPMPLNSNDLPIYFEAVDGIFIRYEIDEDLRIPLLTPFLTDTARRLLSTLPSQDVSSYIKWQQALLREHRLTPRAYLKNYLSANRNDGESCVQFSTRLTCLFKYYLNSRHVDGSFEKLQNLILADRLKASLKDSTRFHIADKEGDTWQKPSVLAELVDLYEGERRDSYSQNSRFSAASYTHSYNDNNNNKFQTRESVPRP